MTTIEEKIKIKKEENEKKYKIIPLYMDLQAKNLFGTERNVMFTEDLLEKYFNYEKGYLRGCKISNSVVITSELIKGKKIEMDIKVELPNKDIINLEFYSRYDEMSEIKSFIYITKVFGNQLQAGEYYDKIKKIKQINFIYDDGVRDDDKVIKRYAVINRDDPFDYILKNNFEIDIVNLAIKEDMAYNGINKGLVSWIKFIGASTYEEMLKISKNEPILMEALKEMERFSNNEEVQDLFTREMLDKSRESYYTNKGKEEGFKQGEKQGFKKGEEHGKQQGIEETKYEIAKNLLSLNISINNIEKATGLLKEEIEKL